MVRLLKLNLLHQKKTFWFNLTVVIIIAIMISTLLAIGFKAAYENGKMEGYEKGVNQKTIIVHTDFNNTELPIISDIAEYEFLPKEMSDYICALSSELYINPDLVVAILMKENPEFNPSAQHQNENGTIDMGLMQLNDRYIWSVFVPSYWDLDIEFNPFNWKHNLFLSMHLIKDLSDSLKVVDDVIMAYNAGTGRVMSGNVPSSTYQYLASVKNNLSLLQKDKL